MDAFGHAGRILRVDLSCRRIDTLPTSDYADRFLGGRGIATRLYWDYVPPSPWIKSASGGRIHHNARHCIP
jgi:aldehyde:ferredoxin oxidoreductase